MEYKSREKVYRYRLNRIDKRSTHDSTGIIFRMPANWRKQIAVGIAAAAEKMEAGEVHVPCYVLGRETICDAVLNVIHLCFVYTKGFQLWQLQLTPESESLFFGLFREANQKSKCLTNDF